MNKWFQVPDESKRNAYSTIAAEKGIPASVVEKDWWVVQTLRAISTLEVSKYIVFKGGTSLSKAWGIISRFSEDIDLSLDRSFFGFEGDSIGNDPLKKLRKSSNKYITDVFLKDLNSAFENQGLSNFKLELEPALSSDTDPRTIILLYPYVTERNEYIEQRVKIEIGVRALREPFTNKPISAFIDQVYHDREFAQKPLNVPSVTPDRAFLEKIFLLHEDIQRKAISPDHERKSRHLYDLYYLSETDFADQAINNKTLYQTIVKHRHAFTRWSGLDYNLHNPKTINFIPPDAAMADWKDDYSKMLVFMIPEDEPKPTFEQIIDALTKLKKRFENISWVFDLKLEPPKTKSSEST